MADLKSSVLRESGIGAKDRRAALAAEFFATLDATHGNSSQAKALNAILSRAEVRYAKVAARKAAKVAAAAEPVAEPKVAKVAKSRKASAKVAAPKVAKVRSVDPDTRADADEFDADASGFVARMRAAAAAAEAAGERV
jgi:hypothetical protein